MKPFRDCRYSVFVSYAHEDDTAENGWVSKFADVLKAKLQNRLRRAGVPKVHDVHLSGRNGPVNGPLAEELEANVADSYAMVIVVHNCYVLSEWCLKELEYFRARFGDEGLRDRLYIVAMSKGAIDDVVAKPDWRRLTLPGQTWVPFYRDSDPERPARVRMENNEFSELFDTQVEKMLKKLEESVKSDLARPAPAQPPLLISVPRAAAAIPAATGSAGPVLFGVPSPELADAVTAVAEQLRARGATVEMLAADALQGGFQQFDQARLLVLPFAKGGSYATPFNYVPGGYLAMQRSAWQGKGRSPGDLLWLDLRATAGDLPAGPGHDDLVAQIADQALTVPALVARLTPAPAPTDGDGGGPVSTDLIHIYIESNQHDVDLWTYLGRRMTKKWDELVVKAGDPTLPRLSLFPRGLSLQRLEKEKFDDADGIVLLWGKKHEESLLAQIRKVDDRLPRSDPPPGIVAYLMPQQPVPETTPMEAKYWKVLQFKDADKRSIDIVPEEGDRLQVFLEDILERSIQRRTLGQARPTGAVQ
ncbi:MAG: hypothetical protein RL375_2357 [Pseudomonadota bacterium]